MYWHLLILALSILDTNAYVLLQVRKGENQSDVDALIHKVVPLDVGSARKHFNSYSKNGIDKLESIVIAIDSGVSRDDDVKSDIFDRIVRKVSSVFQRGAMHAIPKYRARLAQYHIKPAIVHFKSGKPSVMLEINTREIMRSFQEFLSSKTMKRYTDALANKAAFVYRAVTDEFLSDNS